MRIALILLASLTAWATPAAADTPIDLAPCLAITTLLPASITTLDVADCRADPSVQTRAVLTYFVPANTLAPLAQRLETDYAMSPLRFVCCGYEAATAGTIPIPDGHVPRSPQQQLTGDYNAIQTVLQITLTAPAFPIGQAPDDTVDPSPLGTYDGLLILTLSDI